MEKEGKGGREGGEGEGRVLISDLSFLCRGSSA